MRRREFFGLVSAAAVASPLVAHAQQPAMPVIGFLDSRSPDALADRLRGFRQGRKDTGYVEGENVAIGQNINLSCWPPARTWPLDGRVSLACSK